MTRPSKFRLRTKREHSFRAYGSEELICRCGCVAPRYELPKEKAELDAWLKQEGVAVCFELHHSELSRLIAACGEKISQRWSWPRKCETALILTGRMPASA